jgi:predicted RNA methylase
MNNVYAKILKNKPERIFEIIRSFDGSEEDIDDTLLDELLGIPAVTFENEADFEKFTRDHGNEQFTYEGTPYNLIRDFLTIIQPDENDIIYDLGAGYGKIAFYGAATTKSFFKNIEIVPDRVDISNQIKKRFKFDNTEFVQGNVLDFDLSDGTVFFLFNPFSHATLEKLSQKLHAVSQIHPIKIVTWGGPSNDFFEKENWLKIKFTKNMPYSQMLFFESL